VGVFELPAEAGFDVLEFAGGYLIFLARGKKPLMNYLLGPLDPVFSHGVSRERLGDKAVVFLLPELELFEEIHEGDGASNA